MENENPLFWPIQVGNITLNHRYVVNGPKWLCLYKSRNWLSSHTFPAIRSHNRVVMAPMTRCRAIGGVPQAAHVKHYAQRASPGGLLITEANAVAPEAHGFPHSPGIYTEQQVDAWRKVVDAVHAKGSYIYCQIWHVGRASHTYHQPNGQAPVSSTSNRVPLPFQARLEEGHLEAFSQPRALLTHEIPAIVNEFQQAALNAIAAGFDGVEVHCAHGYLVDQFLKGGINDRADEYGGSIANRCKFLMEVMGAVTGAIGAGRTSARISPIIDHLGAADSDPVALGVHVVRSLSPFRLAYLHITEPRLHAQGTDCGAPQTCHVYRREYSGGVVIGSGGFTRDEAMEAVRSGYADAVSFGRAFLANPDLPLRFYLDLPLNEYDRSSFYTHDPVVGYTDYPTFDQSRLRTEPLPSPLLPVARNIPVEQI